MDSTTTHNRRTTADVIVDAVMVICFAGMAYGLLLALGF
jgi:hypothetical protein